MKKKSLIVFIAAWACIAMTGLANTAVWTGGGVNNNWGNPDNWLDENPPDAIGAEAVFSNSGADRLHNNIIGASRTIGFLSVNANVNDINDVNIALRNPQSTLHRTLTFEVSAGSAGITIDSAVTRDVSIIDDMGQVDLASDLLVNHAGSGLLSILRPVEGTGSLTLSGGGTMTLGAQNSYSGGTTVSSGTLTGDAAGAFGTGSVWVEDNGTLVLKHSDTIHEDASLILTSSAGMDLDFTGTQTLLGLSLDGGDTWMDLGTYDAEALGSSVTGSGSIEVIPEPATLGVLILGGFTALLIRRGLIR